MKSSKVSIKTRSTPASLSFKGQATKQETVKWSIWIVNFPHMDSNIPANPAYGVYRRIFADVIVYIFAH